MFEVEKRSFIESKEVHSIKNMIDKKAKLTNQKKFHTLLYPKPSYLRIRWADNKKDLAQITVKKGTYADEFREEHELSVAVKDIKIFVKIFKELGFDKCSYFKSQWRCYEYKGFKIDLTKHDYLGTILEIEKVTSNKKEIKKINEQIKIIMNELGLKELGNIEYQEMMNKLYKKTLKSVNAQKILKMKNN